MRRLYEFECKNEDCKTRFDEYVTYEDIPTVKCPECGTDTTRLYSPLRMDPRLGVDPSFPTMADKWARTRRQRAKIESQSQD